MENNIFNLASVPPSTGPVNPVAEGNLLGMAANAAPLRYEANLASLAAPYDAAIFLDNDSKYTLQVKKCGDKIQVRKVAGTGWGFSEKPFASSVYTDYISRLSPAGVLFAEAIARLISQMAERAGVPPGEGIDEGSGIGPGDIAAVNEWIAGHAGQKLAVLLDYDRTLTQIEGAFFIGSSFQEMKKSLETEHGIPSAALTIDGFVDYYVGGPQRVAMLQGMFDRLYATPDLSVFILTNNPACYNYVELFTEVISVLTRGRPFQLVCSALTQGNKKTAIQTTPALQSLCAAVGGRRKRKTKRNKRSKRKTRRHR